MQERRLHLVALAIVIAIVGCAPANERVELDNAISTAAAAAGDGGTVVMGDVVTVDWDSMYAFDAYVTDEEIRAAMGDSWPGGDESRIPSDGWGLVVFVKDQRVAAWSDLNRHGGPAPVRFDQPGQAILREDARFIVDARDMTTDGRDILYLGLGSENSTE